MRQISGEKIVSAVKSDDLEASAADGTLVLFLKQFPILRMPTTESPRIAVGFDHSVTVRDGNGPMLQVDCGDEIEARGVSSILAELLTVE